MTARKRLTWSSKTASPPPADPGYEEPSVHPAAYSDPGPDEYKNGDTSSWAEDPHPGPYPNTPHPALPGTEAPQGHPATDTAHYFPQGVGKQAAAQLRAAMEVKASKCIRIAQAMLGKKASVEMVEDQALDLMNLTERQIQAALARLVKKADEDGDDEADKAEDDDVSEKEESKKAADADPNEEADKDEAEDEKKDLEKDEETAGQKAARLSRQAAYWLNVAKKAGEIPEALKGFQFGKKDDKAEDKKDDKKEDKAEDKKEDKKASAKRATTMPGDQNDPEHYNYRARGVLADELEALSEDEDEELLAEMLKEESKKAAEEADKAEDDKDEEAKDEEAKEAPAKEAALDPEEEALLAGMLADDDAPAVTACGDVDVMEDPAMDMVVEDDPMGLMDDSDSDLMTNDELSALYGSKFAGDEEDEEAPAEDKKEEAKKEASAKTAQHPQPRRTSNGVRALGGTPRVASTGNEAEKLSSLWETAPDISKIFG